MKILHGMPVLNAGIPVEDRKIPATNEVTTGLINVNILIPLT